MPGEINMKFFKCAKCGKIAVLLKESACGTFCCGEEMAELKPGTTDASAEKHVPVLSADKNTVKVTVGSVAHPMEEKHFIEWIVVETKKGSQKVKLEADMEPKAEFILTENDEFVAAYAYCNLHGLWKSN